jgi:hypothetical protein
VLDRLIELFGPVRARPCCCAVNRALGRRLCWTTRLSRRPASEWRVPGVRDVLVSDKLLQFWVGNELLKTVARTSTGEIRTKRAQGTATRTRMASKCDTSTGAHT